MSEISPLRSNSTALRGSASSVSAARPAPPPNREEELSRQLDERLSGQLARIRQRIGPNTDVQNSTTDGKGSVLDIRA